MLEPLRYWKEHNEGNKRCHKFGDDCPLMGKMPELIHERLGFESEEPFDKEDEKRSTDTDSDTADRSMKTTSKRRKTSL